MKDNFKMGREKNDALSQLLAKSKQLESLRQVQKQQEVEKLKHPKKTPAIKIQEMPDDKTKKRQSDLNKKSINTRRNTSKEIVSDNVVLKSPSVESKPSAVDTYPETNKMSQTSADDQINTHDNQIAKGESSKIEKERKHVKADNNDVDESNNVTSETKDNSKINDVSSTPTNKDAIVDDTVNKNVSDKPKQNFNDILANIARKARANSQSKDMSQSPKIDVNSEPQSDLSDKQIVDGDHDTSTQEEANDTNQQLINMRSESGNKPPKTIIELPDLKQKDKYSSLILDPVDDSEVEDIEVPTDDMFDKFKKQASNSNPEDYMFNYVTFKKPENKQANEHTEHPETNTTDEVDKQANNVPKLDKLANTIDNEQETKKVEAPVKHAASTFIGKPVAIIGLAGTALALFFGIGYGLASINTKPAKPLAHKQVKLKQDNNDIIDGYKPKSKNTDQTQADNISYDANEKKVIKKLTADAKATKQPFQVTAKSIGGGYILGNINYYPNDATKQYNDYSIEVPTKVTDPTQNDRSKQIEDKLKKDLPTINKTIHVIDKNKVSMKTYEIEPDVYDTILLYDNKPFGFVKTDKQNQMTNVVTTYYVQHVTKDDK